MIIGDLRNHQRQIKENTEYYQTQMKSFRNLQAILEIKRKSVADRGDNLIGYQDNQAQGYDRFVVREWLSVYRVKVSPHSHCRS